MNPKLKKSLIVAASVLGCVLVVALSVSGMGGTPAEQLSKMSPEERAFCLQILWKIKTTSTRSDVEALLGEPSRDLVGLKVNWWVKLGTHKARVGVYFTTDGLADEVILDGGSGRYYYSWKVAEHSDERAE